MRARATLGTLALVAVGFACGSADASERRAAVVMFHPGGYVLDDPSHMSYAKPYVREAGLVPFPVDYTLADPAQAFRDAKAAARRARRGGRTVYAYGESAGGGLAARLAQSGWVERAAAISPLADLDNYANRTGSDPAEQRSAWGSETTQERLSPINYRSEVPILALVGADERGGWYANDIRRWAMKDPAVRHRVVAGGHIAAGAYEPAIRRALRFLVR